MEFIEKARIRMEHWIGHNDHHVEDYDKFAGELEAAGQAASAEFVRQMADLTRQSNDLLRRAIAAMET